MTFNLAAFNGNAVSYVQMCRDKNISERRNTRNAYNVANLNDATTSRCI